MKTKIIFLATGLLLLSVTSWAQSFGIRSGVTLSTERAKALGVSVATKSKVGFMVGAFSNWEISQLFSIQSELNFTQMGSKVGDVKETLDYLALPILAKFNLGNLGIFTGPQTSFLIGGRAKEDGVTEGVASDFKMLDFSAVGGAEYTIAQKLVVGARYQLGLINTSDNKMGIKLSNRGAAFTLGYKF